MSENSPAIHCWDKAERVASSPGGKAEGESDLALASFIRPSGTFGDGHQPRYPPINRWAIIDPPYGRKNCLGGIIGSSMGDALLDFQHLLGVFERELRLMINSHIRGSLFFEPVEITQI
jgi:hypothetical protein